MTSYSLPFTLGCLSLLVQIEAAPSQTAASSPPQNRLVEFSFVESGIASAVAGFSVPAVQLGYDFTLWHGCDGVFGGAALYSAYPNAQIQPGCEYPVNSGIDHLDFGGLLFGAILQQGASLSKVVFEPGLVTRTGIGDTVSYDQSMPTNSLQPWVHISRAFENAVDYCDVGQETNSVSESDYIFDYTDTARISRLYHQSLGIRVVEHSYAWLTAVREPILPLEYTVVNIGQNRLIDVYAGLFLAPDVRMISHRSAEENLHGYWYDCRTAYVEGTDQATTPIGFTILDPATSWSEPLKYSFRYVPYAYLEGSNFDILWYNALSGSAFPGAPLIQTAPPIDPTFSYANLFSFGPIDTLNPGDSVKFSFALVSGSSLELGANNVHDNAREALTLYGRNFLPEIIPPSPNVRIETGYRRASLNWSYDGKGANPVETWDGASNAAELYPSNHWRRINPPAGCSHGGRIFAGYRLYRSEDPAAAMNSFTLIGQWDVKDSVGPQFGYQTGIETTFVDSNLVTDKTYWYAVTSFAIPDAYVSQYIDSTGSMRPETLYTKTGRESSLLAARKKVNIPFSVSTGQDKVLVVPNPYRVDQDYTFENGGWEGRARAWNETKRLIKFIHLPALCTIRIFTVAGELVSTITHQDPNRGEEEWHLLSDSGRAIASGLYVYTVESDIGRQVGKFVIIR